MATGFVHVYTGSGKGKTTAALGLTLRAVGAGFRVFFAQFIKGMRYSEIAALERFSDQVVVRQYGRGCFIERDPDVADVEAARHGLQQVRGALRSADFQLVVLDEANVALDYGLLELSDVLDALQQRRASCEVVITGRNAPARLLEYADLVTDMHSVKHYYEQGILARVGIER